MIMKTVGYVILALVIYDVVKWVIDLVWDIMTSKPGLPNNRPTPLNRKSFKERLAEKADSWDSGVVDTGPKPPPRHHRLYQPTNKVDTSNPPKETGT